MATAFPVFLSEQLELIIRMAPAVFWVVSPQNQILFISERWTEYTGLTLSETSAGWGKVIHPRDLKATLKTWARTKRSGKSAQSQLRILNGQDNQFRWHLLKMEPCFDKSGNVNFWIAMLTDIDKQKSAEELLQVVINSIPGVIWWKDLEGKYLGCSMRNAIRAGLKDPTEMIGKTDFEMPWREQAPLYTEADKRVIERNMGECNIIEPICLADGKVSWLNTSKVPFHDAEGNVAGTVGNYVDITDQVKLLQQREDFISSLAHDLKVPIIAAIRAFEILTRGYIGELTAEQQNMITMLLESHESLLLIIQNLLQVLRYEAHPEEIRIEECDLVPIIEKCCIGLKPIAYAKNISFSYSLSESLPLKADTVALERLINNLVGNALKFTPQSGSVTLIAATESAVAKIVVSDSGPGIREEDQEQLFQRFARSNSKDHSTTGSGLGLYLCRQIAEGHGGTIRLKSSSEKGSTFEIEIPLDGPRSPLNLRLV
jgi:PAS domain S-box-containing protein